MASKTTELTEQAAADVVDGDWFLFVDLTGPASEKLSVASARSALARLGLNPPTTGILAINGTTQINWNDGALYPETTNDVDLGSTTKLFKNGYLTNLDLGASGAAGTLDIFPTTASKGKLQVSVTDQTGDTTVSLAIGAMAAARTITLRDPGAAASILTTTDATAAATTATAVELNYLDITTLGTGAASKAVVLDAGEDYTWPATGVLTYGVLNDGTTALAATALEINRTCDVSSRLVLAGSTLAVTVALHDGKIIKLDQLAGSVCTLPAATGSGARFEFITGVLATSNSHVIKVADASGLMAGVIVAGDNADGTATAFATVADSDTITLNRTTTGSVRIGGDRIILTDIATNVYSVSGNTIGTGGEATPFSATV